MKLVCCNLAARRRFPSSCCSYETSNSAVSKQLDQKKSTETVHRQMHRSKRTVITIMLTIHPSLCSLPPSAPELCGTNFNESSVTGGVRFLISCLQQNDVRIQHKQRCTQQKELVGVLWVSTRLLLECHADFRSCSQATSSSALRKQLTSCFGAGCVSDKDQHCGRHSERPAGINHCQDASDPLKIPFSWVLRDHKLQVI